MSIEAFPREFVAWAAAANWHVLEEQGVRVVANEGGEIRYLLRAENEVIALSRAERSEDERPVLWSSDLDTIERFLSAVIGEQLRVMRGLARISLPWQTSQVASGFEVVDLGGRRLQLMVSGGGPVATFYQHGTPEPIIGYSYYANATPNEVRASFADPAGQPVFSDHVAKVTS